MGNQGTRLPATLAQSLGTNLINPAGSPAAGERSIPESTFSPGSPAPLAVCPPHLSGAVSEACPHSQPWEQLHILRAWSGLMDAPRSHLVEIIVTLEVSSQDSRLVLCFSALSPVSNFARAVPFLGKRLRWLCGHVPSLLCVDATVHTCSQPPSGQGLGCYCAPCRLLLPGSGTLKCQHRRCVRTRCICAHDGTGILLPE